METQSKEGGPQGSKQPRRKITIRTVSWEYEKREDSLRGTFEEVDAGSGGVFAHLPWFDAETVFSTNRACAVAPMDQMHLA